MCGLVVLCGVVWSCRVPWLRYAINFGGVNARIKFSVTKKSVIRNLQIEGIGSYIFTAPGFGWALISGVVLFSLVRQSSAVL
jgi:hypothetical protein